VRDLTAWQQQLTICQMLRYDAFMAKGSPTEVPFSDRLTVRLTGGVIAVLLLIGVPFLLVFLRLLRSQQIETMTEATATLNRVVVDGLRSSMLAGQPHMLDETVRNLAEGPQVERVLLVDHAGRVRLSSDPAYQGQVLDRDREAACTVCHQPGGGLPASRTVVARDGEHRVFRAMSTIANEPRCHACHDPRLATNGILVMDLTLRTANQHLLAQAGGTLAIGALMAALTILVLILLLRRMVHGPLRAVVATSRRIARGDLDARVAIDGGGEFALLAAHLNQMTDHLARSLRTVETQRHELQAILDAVDDEIVVLDRQLRVVAANQAFRRSSGRPGMEIDGRPCRDTTTGGWPCDADRAGGCLVARVFETGGLHKGILSRLDTDGQERTIEVHASPLRGPEGDVILAVEARRDISERRQLEASVAHAELLASLGLLASGLAHEINNPLGAISTSIDGLRRRIPRDPGIAAEAAAALEPVLQRIGHEVQRCRAITHRLLKVARPPGRTRSLVDVNMVVEDILAVLSHDIRKARIATRLELGHGLPPHAGDESRLAQIVMNVTLNAIQAMDGGGGTLRIATAAGEGPITIEVEDTGCGIPHHLLKKVFDPFFTTKPAGRGTGLGLFITHRMVAEIGGNVQIASQPGRGTLVTIHLPRTATREPR
jgi:PAS domain S-box-containing protein